MHQRVMRRWKSRRVLKRWAEKPAPASWDRGKPQPTFGFVNFSSKLERHLSSSVWSAQIIHLRVFLPTRGDARSMTPSSRSPRTLIQRNLFLFSRLAHRSRENASGHPAVFICRGDVVSVRSVVPARMNIEFRRRIGKKERCSGWGTHDD
jgi:hypothetical protein